MRVDFGRMFRNPRKKSRFKVYEFILSAPYHLVLDSLGISWEAWLEPDKYGKPIYSESTGDLLAATLPHVIACYSVEWISELAKAWGVYDKVQQREWFVHFDGYYEPGIQSDA